MKFGLSGCGGGFEAADVQALSSFARSAERMGFHGLWLNEEHFQGPSGGRGRLCLSPVVLAAFLAAQTHRIRIGFSVLLLPLHQPLRLAEELATLDILSGGRLDCGISRGGNPGYSAAYGVDPSEGREKFEKSLDFMLDCWSDKEIAVGSHTYAVLPKPVQHPHPPIYVGTYNEGTARWVARKRYKLIQHGIQSLDNVRRVLDAYAGEAGERACVPLGRFVYVSQSDRAARTELEPVIRELTERLRRAGVPSRPGTFPDRDLAPDRFLEHMVITGSPETCAQKIKELRTHLGIEYVNALASFFGLLPVEQLRQSLHLLSTEVMPNLVDPLESATDCCCGKRGTKNNQKRLAVSVLEKKGIANE